MKIDLSQFRQTFMQESAEHVESMETDLLALRSAPDDVETLNAIFRSAHSIKGGAGSFGLTSLVRFTHALENLLDRLRSRKWQFWRRRPSPEDEQAILSMAASTAPESEARYFAGEIGTRLNVALMKLSPRQRSVFTLRHFEDMSLEEIGNLLGLDVGTVKAHMFRAVTKLRAELRDLYEGTHV